MKPTRCMLAIIVGTVILFAWNAISSFLLPWGVGTVSNYSATTGESYVLAAPGLKEAPPETWTTEAFEDQLGHGISTVATDRSFSWIVSVPRERYSLPRFLGFQLVTQVGVAFFLVLAVWLLKPLTRGRRLVSVLVLGVAGMIATYGVMMVWWGMPAAYGVGSAVNLLVGWMMALLVVDRLVLGKETEALTKGTM